MKATGNVLPLHGRNSYSGLADGPLLVLDQMELSDEARKPIIDSIFTENPSGLAKMSVGHRQVAEQMQPQFAKLKGYYVGMTGPHVAELACASPRHRLQLGRHRLRTIRPRPSSSTRCCRPTTTTAPWTTWRRSISSRRRPEFKRRSNENRSPAIRAGRAGHLLLARPARPRRGRRARRLHRRHAFASVLLRNGRLAGEKTARSDDGGGQRHACRLVAGRRRAMAAHHLEGHQAEGLAQEGRAGPVVRR